VNYTSGTGTNTLTFNYTVFAGDNTAKLDYAATSSLVLNGGTVKDAMGNNASLTLPAPGASGSLGANKTLVIDTTVPTITYTSIVPTSPNTSLTPQVNVSLSEAASNVRLFSESTCNSAISAAGLTGNAGANAITTTSLPTNAATAIFGRVTDLAGNLSSCTSLTSYTNDSAAPTVTSVSSTAANGTYRVAQVVPVTVTFSEVVNITGGTPQLTLATGGGANNAVVNYVSGSGTNTLTFNYTVAIGQSSADLDYASTSALSANGASIKDVAGNEATLTLAAPGGVGSLAAQKAIVIDTTPPTLSYVSVSPTSPGTSRTPAVSVTASEAVNVTLYSDVGCGTPLSAATAVATGATQPVTTFTLTANSATTIYGKAVNAVANASACTLLTTYTHDSTPPSISSFTRAAGQVASTNSVPMNFTVTFSESIIPASFTAADISNTGTATGVTWAVTNSGNNQTFTVAATAATAGTLIPRIAANGVTDVAGNANVSASDSAESVSYSPAALSVTLNQAAGQVDPVNIAPVRFTVVFSTAINPASFTTADIVQSGTAAGITWSLSTADNITWSLHATSVTTSGTVIPGIAANAVVDTFGNGNSSSTGTDTSVTYDVLAPTITLSSVSPSNPAATLTPTILGTVSETSTMALFYDSACATPRSATVANTVFAAPGITVTSNVNSNNTTVIYAQATDTAGNVSTCTNIVTYTNDSAPPTVTNVSSTLANGSYRVGQSAPITVTFSKAVIVTGTPQLTLVTSLANTAVNYSSGSGTNTLTFNYIVSAGDNTVKLDYPNTSALALNSGTIRDSLGNNASVTLPTSGFVGSLAANTSLVIDTTAPVATLVAANSSLTGTSQTPTITLNMSEATTALRLFSDAACTVAASGSVAGAAGNNALVTTTLTANTTTSLFIKGTDVAGNVSGCAAIASYTHDGIAPAVTSVSSTAANGTYGLGSAIAVTVTFAENVTVTGTPQLTLATGGSNTVVNYVSGNGTKILQFEWRNNY
jgi:hypothetical protein